MRNKIISLLMVLVLVFALSACSKDDETPSDAVPTNPIQHTNENGENPDAWWQQYVINPDGQPETPSDVPATNAPSTPSSNGYQTGNGTSANNKPTKAPSSTSKPTQNVTAPKEDYTKVNNNTMKYLVKDGNGQAYVTLTKDPTNKFIKDTLQIVNQTFSLNLTASNVMCYSNELSGMKGKTLVYVFSGNKKTAQTLMFVVQFNGDTPVPFVKVTLEGTEQNMVCWPCAASGNTNYNDYLALFKQGVGNDYSRGTQVFLELLSDECVKTFLSW